MNIQISILFLWFFISSYEIKAQENSKLDNIIDSSTIILSGKIIGEKFANNNLYDTTSIDYYVRVDSIFKGDLIVNNDVIIINQLLHSKNYKILNSFKNENYIFFLNEINTVESLYLYNDFDDVNPTLKSYSKYFLVDNFNSIILFDSKIVNQIKNRILK